MFLTRTSVKKLQKKKSLWNMFRKTPKVLQEDHKKEEREKCSDEHGESVKTQKTLSQRKQQMKLHQTDQSMEHVLLYSCPSMDIYIKWPREWNPRLCTTWWPKRYHIHHARGIWEQNESQWS